MTFHSMLSVAAASVMLGIAPMAMAADQPTDAQIAHIAVTAGTLDIENAKLALTNTSTQAVLDFANQMIKDHSAVNDQAVALAGKLGITPEDNPTSQALTEAQTAEQDKLRELKDAEFDKEYVANEVAFHKTVNEALETTLIPAAQNPELKSFLEVGLKLFQGHQQHAEMVQKDLE